MPDNTGKRAIEADGLVKKDNIKAAFDQQLVALAQQNQAEQINRKSTERSLEDRLAAIDAEHRRARVAAQADVTALLEQHDERLELLASRYDEVKADRDALTV